jgi:hypothetical protein
VSNAVPESSPPEVPSWNHLELTVRRLMDDHEALRRRVLAAEQRVRELESALAEVSTGKLDPLAVSARAQSLERENRLLARRMNSARETVERILNRIQFVEEDR